MAGRAPAPCARYFAGEGLVTLGLRVTPGGAITAVASARDALTQCLASTARAQKLAPGRDRLVQLELGVSDPGLPALELSSSGLPGDTSRVDTALAEAARGARSCLSRELAEARPLPRVLLWRTTRGSRALTLEWAADPSLEGSEVLGSEAARCVEQAMTRACVARDRRRRGRRGRGPDHDWHGSPGRLARRQRGRLAPHRHHPAGLRASPSPPARAPRRSGRRCCGSRPGPTSAAPPRDAGAGQGRRDRRRRAHPRAGGYSGALPEKLYLSGRGKPLEATLDRETRRARFTLPADAEGWLEVAWGGARAMVFVQDPAELVLSIKPERETYAPGQTARLAIPD